MSPRDNTYNPTHRNLNKTRSSISLYQYLLIHGRVPHEPGIISLLAKEDNSNTERESFTPQRITFTLSPPNTNISIQRSFTMLESISKQDIFKWKDEILQTMELAAWDEPTTIGVIKASVASKYLHLLQNKTTLNEVWTSILQYKYPPNEYLRYLNQLSNTHQNSFLTIKEYYNKIEQLCLRLGICLNWTDELRRLKIQEAFFNGLSKRCQLEMARLNIHDCTDIYSIINTTEETMIEQIKSMKTDTRRQPRRNDETGRRHDTNTTPNKNSKFCEFHKVTTHDTKECRARKKSSETIGNRKNRPEETKMLAIKETPVKASALETNGYIDGTKVNLTFDTGSAYSYIDKGLVEKLKLESVAADKRKSVTVNGCEILTSEEVNFKLQMQGDKCNHYKVNARILEKMTTDLILGVDFMIKNKTQINLETAIISLDNKEYDLSIALSGNEADRIFNNKTSILKVDTQQIPRDLETQIKDYRANNPIVGTIEQFKHTIHYNSPEVIALTPYKVPLNIRKQTKAEIKRLLELKIIQKSNSPFNSPALPIFKRDGTVRLAIDYRRINANTTPESYPFPEMTDIITDLKGSAIFSQIDLSMGYYQIAMDPQSRKYTSFSIFGEHYEFLRMPFGLTNAPRTFQRAMNHLLGEYDFVKIFLDDILIHSRDFESHTKHLAITLKILKTNNVAINFDKTRFFKQKVTYLGHIIDKHGSRADISRLVPIEKLIPRTKRQLQRLLGVLNWYRPYLPNLSMKIIKLTDKLKGNSNFKWDADDDRILNNIYNDIKRQVIIYFPDISKPFELESDASDRGMGSILRQENKIVGIFSAKFNKTEENYSVVEKETWAIVKSLLHFKNIIFNSRIIVKTDNKDLMHIGSMSKRLERWKIILEEFQIEMQYIEGKHNSTADTLSRIYLINGSQETELIPPQKIQDFQKGAHYKQENIPPEDITRNSNGILLYKNDRVFIPKGKSSHFIKYMHELLVHPGENKLYHSLKRFFFVAEMRPTIKRITASCLTCCKCKNRTIRYGKVSGGINARDFLDVISSDIFGPIKSHHFKHTRNHEKFYIITFTDIYSRFTTVDILFDISALSVTKSFEEHVLGRLGCPKKLLTDQGRQYISEYFRDMLKANDIIHITTSAYNPTGNSISERINTTIGDICRMSKGKSVFELKRLIETRLNHTYHRVLESSPYEILFKYSAIDPIKRMKEKGKAESNEKIVKWQNNRRTNEARKSHKYTVGDKVFKRTHHPDKINDIYSGPFEILEVSKDENVVTINEPTKLSRQNIKNITPFCPGRREDVVHDPLGEVASTSVREKEGL
ncbi:Transposon Tf2-6 polyprotein [Dictyocoela roeselum]|nr:Transposon Tf2-6 polyprotein [Dictyocoela roeselum]